MSLTVIRLHPIPQLTKNTSVGDNIGDLVPPVAVFWYRRFTLSDFS